jgi:hypothetical protein
MDGDGPARLLARVVLLLPASRRGWGRAMLAELAALRPHRERWVFALGCCRAVLSRPIVLRRVCRWAVAIGASAAAVVLASGIGFAAGRDGMLLMLASLAAAGWLVRRPAGFRHVAVGRVARAVLAGGYALLGAKVFLEMHRLRHVPVEYVSSASTNALTIVWTATLTVYLVAVVRITACGSPALRGTLAVGAGTGAAGAAAWLTATVLHPEVPGSTAPAVIVISGVVGIGWVLGDRSGRRRQGRIAGLMAGASTALLIGLLIDGPLPALPRWVGDDTSPLDSAGFNRLVDPIGIWALGVLLAAGLASRSGRPPASRKGVLIG